MAATQVISLVGYVEILAWDKLVISTKFLSEHSVACLSVYTINKWRTIFVFQSFLTHIFIQNLPLFIISSSWSLKLECFKFHSPNERKRRIFFLMIYMCTKLTFRDYNQFYFVDSKKYLFKNFNLIGLFLDRKWKLEIDKKKNFFKIVSLCEF